MLEVVDDENFTLNALHRPHSHILSLGCTGYLPTVIVRSKMMQTKSKFPPRNLKSAPPKMLYVISCFLFLGCIPARIGQVMIISLDI